MLPPAGLAKSISTPRSLLKFRRRQALGCGVAATSLQRLANTLPGINHDARSDPMQATIDPVHERNALNEAAATCRRLAESVPLDSAAEVVLRTCAGSLDLFAGEPLPRSWVDSFS
jgi:hypothetical protein